MTKENFRTQAELGEQIAHLRQLKGWDQAELGTKVELDQSAISRIERGQRGLTALELHLLARIFEVSAESILMKEAPEPVLLRSGDASDEAVQRGLEVLERAIKQFFGAEELARSFM
jgi:transcriptional regulator with XRE-family HTH domain